jgi:mono/diheme cytochrome c family protein
MKKFFKWTGIIILILVVGVTIVTATRQHLKYEAPYPDIHASADSAIIAKGKHIIFGAAHCVNCHSTANADSLILLGQDVPLSGGLKFELPFGNFYTKNLTPDSATGIGRYTDGEIARVLRYSVHANGEAVPAFMATQNLSDEDLTAIISYLRSTKPVYNKVPDNKLNIMGRIIMAYLVKPVGPSVEIPKSLNNDTSAQYGKYLANVVANCNGCHTKRDMTGAYVGEPFGGGGPFEEPGLPTLTPPNLTTDSTSRIFGWTQEDFVNRFRVGKTIPHTHMPWNAFKRMNEDELKAIYNYLKTLKPVKNYVEQPQLAKK